MADPGGGLNIELRRRDGGAQASIHSSRPLAASRVFVGKRVEDTVASLPALFSICATAQACACASACEAALGTTPAPAVSRLRMLLVDAETVKEHLWRMLLDWPGFMDKPALAKAMQGVMVAHAMLRSALTASGNPLQLGADAVVPNVEAALSALDELARLSAEYLLGVPPAAWLARIQGRENLLAWAGSADTVAAALVCTVRDRGWISAGRNRVTALPRLGAADLEPLLAGADADRFATAPRWKGEPRESSPFTRQQSRLPVAALVDRAGNGLLPRLVAQLTELASLQQGLRSGLGLLQQAAEPSAATTRPGVGIAQIPAARGLLVHRAAVDQGRITEYRILAPTEWNFHPGGVAAQGLSALPPCDAGTLERLASLFVTALDPCVEYHVRVS